MKHFQQGTHSLLNNWKKIKLKMKQSRNSELKFWFWPPVFVFLGLDTDLVHRQSSDGENWYE